MRRTFYHGVSQSLFVNDQRLKSTPCYSVSSVVSFDIPVLNEMSENVCYFLPPLSLVHLLSLPPALALQSALCLHPSVVFLSASFLQHAFFPFTACFAVFFVTLLFLDFFLFYVLSLGSSSACHAHCCDKSSTEN